MGEKTARIAALDVLRGLTVALMIMVNNAGSSYGFMHHAEWNGLNLGDVVFPFFLFIMGASTYLSLSKTDFRPHRQTVSHIIRRTVVIILVCWGIFWISRALHGDFFPFDHFRLTGVLVRIALTYEILATLAVTIDHKWMSHIAFGLLAGYAVLLLLGNGYSNDATNILARVDKAILGPNHLYSRTPVDPEGIPGLIPSIAQGILGFLCGKILKSDAGKTEKIRKAAIEGATLLGAGVMLCGMLPVNKRIWSPTFVLVTSGMAELLLALLIYLIDVRNRSDSPICTFFKVFGTNALILYAFSELLGSVFSATGLCEVCHVALRGIIGNIQLSDLIYSFLFMMLNFLFGLILYRKKVFIKI